MSGKNRQKHKAGFGISLRIAAIAVGFMVISILFYAAYHMIKTPAQETPAELLVRYMSHIEKQEYEEMYQMTDLEQSEYTDRESFIKRNSGIYEGIEVKNIQVDAIQSDTDKQTVIYQMSFDTAAGRLYFENEMGFIKGKDGYKICWHDGLIFPELTASDKVRISSTSAKRGKLLDRNDRMLAGPGTATSVGIVPGKLGNQPEVMQQLSGLLDVEPDAITNAMNASWVKEDSFVPIKTIPKVSELELMSIEPGEKALREKARQDALLAIPGVMFTDVEVREYPFGESAAHLTGYVGQVTAEDLEEHKGEGYTENSVIGRSGLESIFEKELKGRDGCSIYIEDADGNKKRVLADIPVQDGQDIKLTMDAVLQDSLYQQFREDPGCSVAMDPYTGEVLALVSTPSFDSNEMILGLSDERWNTLNEDERNPLFNRFRQVWCPGSTFKPIIAAIGIKTGALEPSEDFGNEGLSWQKDASWGDYFVTTLHAYEPVTMENALIYSDNIYFAKAALKIGADALEHSLKELKLDEQVPFEIPMSASQYSNTGHIETEIQLADSGYGQGQILMNPLHLASLYTAFCNEGNAVKPYLLHKNEPRPDIWIPGTFSDVAAARILEGMKKAVNHPEGTGYAAHREDIVLAGKTGTAEIKASIEDTSGTEIGWFAVFTAEKDVENPVLIVSMVEDVKRTGGSGYVVNKDKIVLDGYLGDSP